MTHDIPPTLELEMLAKENNDFHRAIENVRFTERSRGEGVLMEGESPNAWIIYDGGMSPIAP